MNNKANSSLLLNEYPLVILPKLAKLIGLNEAVVLQQVHYWLGQITRDYQLKGKYKDHLHEGFIWVYNTYEDWQKQVPFKSSRTLRRTITSLENSGLLVSGVFNKYKYDRTKWYRVDYKKLYEIEQTISNNEDLRPCGQNGHMQAAKMDAPIPETTTETTSKCYTSFSPLTDENVHSPSYKNKTNKEKSNAYPLEESAVFEESAEDYSALDEYTPPQENYSDFEDDQPAPIPRADYTFFKCLIKGASPEWEVDEYISKIIISYFTWFSDTQGEPHVALENNQLLEIAENIQDFDDYNGNAINWDTIWFHLFDHASIKTSFNLYHISRHTAQHETPKILENLFYQSIYKYCEQCEKAGYQNGY